MAKHDFEIGFKLIKDPSQIDQWVNTVANKMAKGLSAAGVSSMDAFKKSMESGFSYIFKDFEKQFSTSWQKKVGDMTNNPLSHPNVRPIAQRDILLQQAGILPNTRGQQLRPITPLTSSMRHPKAPSRSLSHTTY